MAELTEFETLAIFSLSPVLRISLFLFDNFFFFLYIPMSDDLDPFECRLQLMSLLKKLNASQQSIQKTARFAVKHRPLSEDLYSCLLEEIEKVRPTWLEKPDQFITHPLSFLYIFIYVRHHWTHDWISFMYWTAYSRWAVRSSLTGIWNSSNQTYYGLSKRWLYQVAKALSMSQAHGR